MADQGSITASQTGSHQPAADAQQRMANRVHAGMHCMEPACGDAVPDRASGQTDLDELPPRYDTVLPSSQLRDRLIHR